MPITSKVEYKKTVVIEPDPGDRIDGVNVHALRSRDSDGYGVITVFVNGVRFVEFDTNLYGGKYEIIARLVARMLEAAADECCLLPSDNQEKR